MASKDSEGGARVGTMRLIIFMILIAFLEALAQTPPPQLRPKQDPMQGGYLTKPLPLSVDTVGPGFKGNDIVALVAELKRSTKSASKSEFETTPQYEQRIRSFLESRSRQYVFVLDEFTAAANYNADKNVMNISVTAPFMVGLFDKDVQMVNDTPGDSSYFSSGFELRSLPRSTTQYVATNGLGVKINVTRSTFDEFGVVISKDDALFADLEPCCDHIGTRATLSIDMAVQTAKALKPFLRVALVCTLVNPTVYEGAEEKSPTISFPREIKIKQQYLLVHPDELWVYDRRSGHILGKFIHEVEPAEVKNM